MFEKTFSSNYSDNMKPGLQIYSFLFPDGIKKQMYQRVWLNYGEEKKQEKIEILINISDHSFIYRLYTCLFCRKMNEIYHPYCNTTKSLYAKIISARLMFNQMFGTCNKHS